MLRDKSTLYIHVVPKELNHSGHDKYFVGITQRTVNERWQNGRGYSHNPRFREAIDKYGWDNILHYVIFDNIDPLVAGEFEKEMIRKLHATDPEYGYNIAVGGLGGNTSPVMPVKQYTLDGDYIKTWPNQTEAAKAMGCHRTNICHAAKHKYTCKGYQWCYVDEDITGRRERQPYSDEYKEKVSARVSGGGNPRARKVICLNTLKVFECMTYAANEYQCNSNYIAECCKGKAKSAGKMNGERLVWRFYDDYLNMSNEQIKEALNV